MSRGAWFDVYDSHCRRIIFLFSFEFYLLARRLINLFKEVILTKSCWLISFIVFFTFITDIRLQLNEQLRCLDMRMESQVALIQELQDFFRRRGEVELDYSKSLDKLAKGIQLRHKEQKQKWVTFSRSFF